MSKAVLISIRPEWCEKIANGEKTIEVRKTCPKLETPFKVYIYCSAGGDKLWVRDTAWRERWINGPISFLSNAKDCGGMNLGNRRVIGEFTCDQIIDAWWDYVPDAITGEVTGGNLEALGGTGMTDGELFGYVGDSMRGHCYGWHISDLKIYGQLRELTEFRKPEFPTGLRLEDDEIKRPPQSWCYVDEL